MNQEMKTEIIEKFGEPVPSNHPDPRMNWTLKDISRMFPTGKFDKQLPLVGRNKEIMIGE